MVNWDQTGSSLVPSSNRSMATAGSEQAEVTGLGDKREITVLLYCHPKSCMKARLTDVTLG